MRQPAHPEVDELKLTEVMAALGDPLRVGLVRLLSDGVERNFGELRAPVAKSTLSHHLKVLRAAGITCSRGEGTRCYVRLRRDDLETRFPQLLDAVLAAAADEGVGEHVGLNSTPTPDGCA
ncbi:ArsR/SmtB family transcription factor [Amycolatopsis albispora]|uniref:Transcriptional regulator n=1 Tax=Amycolatopsis albispora TaxID=1804986 RepID=A0A344LH26_9PSEU|nr:metalloregulator ArsR/SmtB family transcription factor [Amycolatopsis albispora]AXB47350.1 transcriptional regulator [Amycolatopsis albispora]